MGSDCSEGSQRLSTPVSNPSGLGLGSVPRTGVLPIARCHSSRDVTRGECQNLGIPWETGTPQKENQVDRRPNFHRKSSPLIRTVPLLPTRDMASTLPCHSPLPSLLLTLMDRSDPMAG
jgi:hypothetical protein